MGQSRVMSLIEAGSNVLVGHIVAVVVQVLVFPVLGIDIRQNLAIGLAFTAVSLARSYALRRLFEAVRVDVRRPNSRH